MKLSNSKIDFYGNPVAWDFAGKLASFVPRKDILTVVLASAATELCNPQDPLALNTIVMSLSNIFWLVATKEIERWGIMMHAFHSDAIKTKCIETKPDKNTPPTLHKWGPSVARAYAEYWGTSVGIGSLLVIGGAMHPESAPMIIGVTATLMTRLFQGWHRWHKVAKGDWIIVDKGPPPERVKQPRRVFGVALAMPGARRAALAISSPKL